MRFGNAFKVAIRGLLVNKARSLLTLLGIIIGIGAVITILALSEGLKAEAERQVGELGANLLFVYPDVSDAERRRSQNTMRGAELEFLNGGDVIAIEKGLTVPHRTSVLVSGGAVARYRNESVQTQTYGIDAEYDTLFNFKLGSGRAFTPLDIQGEAKVAVLGYDTSETLFGKDNPVGEKITVNGLRFEVIGVFEKKGGGLGNTPDQRVHLPISVAQKRIFGTPDEIHFITIGLENIDDMETAKDDISHILRIRRRVTDGDENFGMQSQDDALQSFSAILGVMTGVLGGIAAVSLLVGGIGIMNIMLVSVTERTREIGLRKSVGARKVDILLQFLIEAVVLCLIGGAVGICVGYLGAIGLSALIRSSAPEAAWDPHISITAIVVAIAFSSLIGIIFGVYPATSAANKNPIDALRYE